MARNLSTNKTVGNDLENILSEGVPTAVNISKEKVQIDGDLECTGNIQVYGEVSQNIITAGSILGYTCLKGDGTNISSFEIQNSITVEDDTHKITFKTPPSENVEIVASFFINRSSTDTRITVGLSDADASTGYNAIGQTFEYDYGGLSFSDDEVDDEVLTARWVLGASELAAVGSSNTFWIGIGTGGTTKTAYLQYGFRSSHNLMYSPFTIKATALPETIYDGQ